MKYVLLMNLKLLTIVNSFLLNIAEHETFVANKYENANYCSEIYTCNDFSTQFRKIILRNIKIGYNINVIRQTTCMVGNPITVNNLASLFACTPTGRASDYDGPSLKIFK